jgi:hypothetical protein
VEKRKILPVLLINPSDQTCRHPKVTYSSSRGGRDSVVTVVTRYGLDGSMFKQALWFKQPSVQGVPVLFSGRGKWEGHGADHLPTSSNEVKNE